MLEALWTAEFETNMGTFGGGVVVFETGRIFGGDSLYYYLGKAEVKNEIVEAEVEVTNHSGPPRSVFGPLEKFHLKLSGRLQRPVMELKGYLVENPSMGIVVRLTHRAELP